MAYVSLLMDKGKDKDPKHCHSKKPDLQPGSAGDTEQYKKLITDMTDDEAVSFKKEILLTLKPKKEGSKSPAKRFANVVKSMKFIGRAQKSLFKAFAVDAAQEHFNPHVNVSFQSLYQYLSSLFILYIQFSL